VRLTCDPTPPQCPKIVFRLSNTIIYYAWHTYIRIDLTFFKRLTFKTFEILKFPDSRRSFSSSSSSTNTIAWIVSLYLGQIFIIYIYIYRIIILLRCHYVHTDTIKWICACRGFSFIRSSLAGHTKRMNGNWNHTGLNTTEAGRWSVARECVLHN